MPKSKIRKDLKNKILADLVSKRSEQIFTLIDHIHHWSFDDLKKQTEAAYQQMSTEPSEPARKMSLKINKIFKIQSTFNWTLLFFF